MDMPTTTGDGRADDRFGTSSLGLKEAPENDREKARRSLRNRERMHTRATEEPTRQQPTEETRKPRPQHK